MNSPILAPVLNIDWLQLNLIAPSDLHIKYHSFFKVKLMPYSTRHFKIVEELYRHKKRIATVTRMPASNIIAKDTILVKFDNWLLYQEDLFSYVSQFIALNNFKFKSISRLDICCDFQYFQNGQVPSSFIKNYLRGDYLRLGRTSISNAHFKQIDTDLFFNALKFGSNLSDISTYLYNKTLEMNCVKWKPWIAMSWMLAGFKLELDTWRLECSLKDCHKIVISNDTGEVLELNHINTLKHDNVELLFNCLREKYFTFVRKDDQVKKSRMQRLKLFKNDYSDLCLINSKSMLQSNRADKIFIKKLDDVNKELRGQDIEMNIDLQILKAKYIELTGLAGWAKFKNLLE